MEQTIIANVFTLLEMRCRRHQCIYGQESLAAKLEAAEEVIDSYQLAANSETKLTKTESQHYARNGGDEDMGAAIAELSKKHEAEMAKMVTKQQHEAAVHALQAYRPFAHAFANTNVFTYSCRCICCCCLWLCNYYCCLLGGRARAGAVPGTGAMAAIFCNSHASHVCQVDLQAQNEKVSRGRELLMTMQQLEVQLESYEQKLRSAKEELERKTVEAQLSKAKLAAANEVNESLQTKLQLHAKKSSDEDMRAAIAELSKKHEAEIAEMVTKQHHEAAVHALQVR